MPLIQENLKTGYLGRQVTYLASTGSTNAELWRLVDDGRAVPGQLVVTDDQRSGKGRAGRRWFSGPGLGLTFSVFLRPLLPLEQLGLLSLAAGVAVVDALANEGLQAKLKWPNDILVDGRKLGGILIESRVSDNKPMVVLGVGLNVNEEQADFPEELHLTAVSVRMVLMQQVQREVLLAGILNRMEELLEGGIGAVVSLWKDRCAHLNQSMRYHGPAGPIVGRFLGVNAEGQGQLSVGDQIHLVTAGDMDWIPEPQRSASVS
ncbi:MAG: biotin--[acetyl-CoA-carboxylase] ligase [Fidelibacterota bacterium]|nr:MAG: biotin--[acetyl-CoA-carboxylase] ligase [Candidatus Neomarinimicrobiota bacterium]